MSRNSLMESIATTSRTLMDFPERARDVQSMRGQLQSLNTRREKIINQLTALSEYDTRSTTFFAGLTDIQAKLDSGICMISTDMSNFTGSFPQRDSIEWAGEVQKRWDKREAALAALQGDDGLSEEEIEAIADYVAINGSLEKEILIYDNTFGYAKYTITIETDNEGKVSLSVGKDGIDSFNIGDTSISKDMVETSSVIQGSALGLDTTYTTGLTKEGFPSLSTSIGGEAGSMEVGVKEHNGQMVNYHKHTANVKTDVIHASIAYEQGYYQRNFQAPPNAAPVTDKVKEFDWGKVGEVGLYVVGVAAVGTALYFAAPFIAAGVATIATASVAVKTAAVTASLIASFLIAD